MRGTGLCTLVTDDRMHRKGKKLPHGRFRLDVMKNFSTGRVVKHWSRLPIEVIDDPCLSIFKRDLDNIFSNML